MDTLRARIAAALAPRYVIEADIGSGGMGHVYRVPDIRLDRRVVVKVLRPELTRGARELWRRAGQEFTAPVSRVQTLARARP
jgi:serine/threonine protein kinase